MGEEKEQSPITPEEVHRSAKSATGQAAAPEDLPLEERKSNPAEDQDKPDYPPQERHGEREHDEHREGPDGGDRQRG